MTECVVCPYCLRMAERVTGEAIYDDRRLANRIFYRCDPCDAHVGTHEDSGKPYGSLANGPTRRARQRAHAAFDPLWHRKIEKTGCSRKAARSAAYAWLAKEMMILPEHCHISMFDEAQCERVVARCAPHLKKINARKSA